MALRVSGKEFQRETAAILKDLSPQVIVCYAGTVRGDLEAGLKPPGLF